MVIGILEIKTRVDLGMLEAIEEFGDKRQRLSIFDGNIVKLVIIDTKAKTSVGFFDKENWRFEG